jgi:hypothetical protein
VTIREFPDLVVAVGEEGSDPIVTHEGRDHRVDEFAASGHLDRMESDLADVAALGVSVMRYGMPWRLTEPAPGEYDWTLWDRALGACADAGLEPVVDLLHFGQPDHYTGFCDPAWVDGFVRYVDAFLARYRDVSWFTPINEPGVHATVSARFGLWNDRRTDLDSHAAALGNVVRANLEAIARVRADRDGWWVGSEAFTCYLDDEGSTESADAARAADWLVWDLHFGLDPLEPAAELASRIPSSVLARIGELAVRDDRRVVAGHDVYPIGMQTFGGRIGTTPRPEEMAIGYRVRRRRAPLARALRPSGVGLRDVELRPEPRAATAVARRAGARDRGTAGERHPAPGPVLVQPGRPVRLAHGARRADPRGDRGGSLHAGAGTPPVRRGARGPRRALGLTPVTSRARRRRSSRSRGGAGPRCRSSHPTRRCGGAGPRVRP